MNGYKILGIKYHGSLHKKGQGGVTRRDIEGGLCEDRGRDWTHAAPNQGTARNVNNQKLRKAMENILPQSLQKETTLLTH